MKTHKVFGQDKGPAPLTYVYPYGMLYASGR
jgi:hypothetical protein